MPRFNGKIGVGDVVVTREGKAWISASIRLGQRMMGLPSQVNHVIIVHHRDPLTERWVGIEGRPSGTGWVDVESRLTMPLTNVNTKQPKTSTQRLMVARAAESLVNTSYDWAAILESARVALKLRLRAAQEWPENATPGSVVCSSFADWAYERAGLANPGGGKATRFTTPGHWDRFIMQQGWAQCDTLGTSI